MTGVRGRAGVVEAEGPRPRLSASKTSRRRNHWQTRETESSEETPDANEQDFEWVDSPAKQAQERQDEMEESGQENPI